MTGSMGDKIKIHLPEDGTHRIGMRTVIDGVDYVITSIEGNCVELSLYKKVKKQGRRLHTGRYKTREELEEMAKSFYYNSAQNIPQVARACGVSVGVVRSILK